MKHYLLLLYLLLLNGLAPAALHAQQAYPIVLPGNYQWPGGDTVSVLSWNVEHFVDQHDNPYIRNSREDNPEKVAEREQLLIRAIRTANADVVVLQEFESAAYLRTLAARHLNEMGYQFFAANESDDWYMNVIVMSRLPLGVMYSYGAMHGAIPGHQENGQPKTQININSRMWSVDVQARPGYRFLLTGLHLKAGRNPEDVATRVGQIQLLRQQFKRFYRENRRVNMLIVGDLNALPDSEELRVFKNGDNYPYGPKSTTERTFALVNPVEAKIIHTHPSNRPARQLDYALFNENMFNEYVLNSFQVGGLLEQSELETLSDHLPVRVRFVAVEQKRRK